MDQGERVILVDERDAPVGELEKLEAHRRGALHRAFSVFVHDREGRVLLQRRAQSKYHSGGLWSNTCCGHPRPGENTGAAATRRLREEMGFECRLEAAGGFLYRARLGDLTEHEFDHVFAGRFDGDPRPDPAEVAEWGWTHVDQLTRDLVTHPERYTVWLAKALSVYSAGSRRVSA
ncbi:MAG TPA: isopentenyl-diphosphate Delta-isomerase [Gemmatimonadales bacterium]|jgi:isopentenyl-diphosphate delta-isomerase|nr:isopentenyl-diphosphate Delta-isomerase [Gemmatimonadales bacterium]